MKNTSKTKPLVLKTNGLEATNNCAQKKIWVSPMIFHWESVNIELGGGLGADGGFASYA